MEEEKLSKKERRALAKEEKRKAQEKVKRTSKLRKWIIGLLVFSAVVYGGFRFIDWLNAPQPEVSQIVEIKGGDWVKGNPEASVTLIEYSDFACPACASYYPIVKRLTEELGQDIKFVYRHYPTVSADDPTYPAFRAGETAGRQGKFWEMHDKLFERQKEWSSDKSPVDKFEGYAQELGLDIERFKNDYESEEIRQKINDDILSARQLAVSATPTFFLNGNKLTNPRGYDAFKSTIEDEIRGYSLE